MTVFQTCSAENDGNSSMVLECVTDLLQLQTNDAVASSNEELHRWLLIISGALVFFMQAGFAMLCAGSVRKKNVVNTLLKNLLDACGAAIAFYVVGFGFAFGNSNPEKRQTAFIGNDNFFLMGDVDAAFFFFQFAFSATAATIVAGTLAERCKMTAYICFSVMISGFVYPVVVHNFWSDDGILSISNTARSMSLGVIDFAGAGAIHVTGGATALYATYILGPRQGRFFDEEGALKVKPGFAKGHSISLQMIGTMILWFGWYGFNPGSALLLSANNKSKIASIAAINTTFSAASGAISALFTNAILTERRDGEYSLDIGMAMNGCLSGLVAITGGCALIESPFAVLIGVVAGWIYIASSHVLIRWRIDDAVNAIPVHLFNGVWGMIAVGLFAAPENLLSSYGYDLHVGWIYRPYDLGLLLAQVVGILFVVVWTLFTMFPLFVFLDRMGWFRVNQLEEIIGLDASYHGMRMDQVDMQNEEAASEENRISAYKKRFKERQEIRENRGNKMSLQEFMNASWGRGLKYHGDRNVESGNPSAEEELGEWEEREAAPEDPQFTTI